MFKETLVVVALSLTGTALLAQDSGKYLLLESPDSRFGFDDICAFNETESIIVEGVVVSAEYQRPSMVVANNDEFDAASCAGEVVPVLELVIRDNSKSVYSVALPSAFVEQIAPSAYWKNGQIFEIGGTAHSAFVGQSVRILAVHLDASNFVALTVPFFGSVRPKANSQQVSDGMSLEDARQTRCPASSSQTPPGTVAICKQRKADPPKTCQSSSDCGNFECYNGACTPNEAPIRATLGEVAPRP